MDSIRKHMAQPGKILWEILECMSERTWPDRFVDQDMIDDAFAIVGCNTKSENDK
jgi:hypothetical protein